MESAFVVLQFYLYRLRFNEHFECNPEKRFLDWSGENWRPCIGTIECYLSRPQEKNIFLWYMYASSGICVLLTLFELGIFLKSGPNQAAYLPKPTKTNRKSLPPNRRLQNRLQARRSDMEMESNMANKSSCALTLTPIGSDPDSVIDMNLDDDFVEM
ncbi:Oidioi.mRNA.OKI2018_I69.PAR.g8894.t1.cds [Oikopleura dioica]|uniref:Oidioi.mRNA.OKI2018_I69.PAR.g8894.t1.cds n=1 Tax=Oikopleura dioica TaxID=34765 RepID=A0ABN7RLG9_OIKDI|nr:Oidioi.mRNA.OKI2018_I69.PAR.g8894.t1.cds [Oikopleura dioica]